MKHLILIVLSLLLTTGSVAQLSSSDQSGEILYICSYNADTYYSIEFINDFVGEYTKLGGKRKMAIEAMNCNTLDQYRTWMSSLEEILKKHPNPSMVVLYGPEAWSCYLSLTDEKWKKVPLCLVASQKYGASMEFDDIPVIHRTIENPGYIVDYTQNMSDFNVKMCYYYEYGVVEDVQIILHLNPSINTLAIVGDNSYGGYSMLRYSTEMIRKNFPKLNVVEIDGVRVDTETASDIVNRLPDNSAIIYAIWRYDRNGTIALNVDQQVFGSRPKMPVLSITGRGFGKWTLGGSNPHYDWHDGRIHPALLAYELLDQRMNIEPYFYRCPNYYQFDLEIVDRLGLDPTLLPDGSVFIHNKLSFTDLYVMYKTEFILSIALLIILLMAFGIMVVYTVRMNIMKQKLEISTEQLKADKKLLEENEAILVTEKEKAEESDKMKTQFMRNISHEIRTPLNAIQGFSQIILDSGSTIDEDAKKNLSQRISQNVEVVTSVVDDILEFSDIESSYYSVKKTHVRCTDLCKDVLYIAENKRKPQVAFNFTSEVEDNMLMYTDAKLVKDVLVQLLKNAFKFTTSGAVLLRCAMDNDGKVVFSVTDTGPGIPEDKSEYIFERFKKLDEFAQGTGLGLSICRIIAEKLDGEVYLDTTYRGGAKFVFTVPLK